MQRYYQQIMCLLDKFNTCIFEINTNALSNKIQAVHKFN